MIRRTVLLTFALVLLAAPAAQADARTEEGGTATVTAPTGALAYTLDDGTATAGEDYTDAEGPTIGGDPVEVVTLEDGKPERDETVIVTFTGAVAPEDAQQQVTITDEDAPSFSIADASGNEDTGAAQLVVRTATPVDREVALDVTALSASALDAQDFDGGRQTVRIPAGAGEAAVRIPLAVDAVDENDELFTVRAAATSTAAVGDGDANFTIVNDDLRSVSVGDARVTEGDREVVVLRAPVTLSAPTFRPVTVQFATLDGPLARAPVDFLARFGTITIPPGQQAASIEIAVLPDERREPAGVFAVVIGQPTGAIIARGGASATILDDDAGPNADDAPPNMRLTRPSLKGRAVRVRMTCPRSERRCAGRLTLFSRADRRARTRTLRRERRLGAKTYTLRGGQARTVSVTIPRTILAAARRTGRLRVRAFAVTRDAAQNVDTSDSAATLRFRR